MIIVIALGALYSRFGGLAEVQRALIGLGAAASGLVVATAARMAEPLLRSRPWLAAPFIAAALRWRWRSLRLPLPYVLLALAPLSIARGLVWQAAAA